MMELQKEQYEQIKDCFPKQRKSAKISNLEVLNAVLYIQVNVISLDSTCIKVHPDGMGTLKKAASSQSGERGVDGISNFIWSPHLIKMG